MNVMMWGFVMEKSIGRCTNRDCSQFGRDKSVVVAQMYGYERASAAVCPECDEFLVVDPAGCGRRPNVFEALRARFVPLT